MAIENPTYVPKKGFWYIISLLNFDMPLFICPSLDIRNVNANGGEILCLREFQQVKDFYVKVGINSKNLRGSIQYVFTLLQQRI